MKKLAAGLVMLMLGAPAFAAGPLDYDWENTPDPARTLAWTSAVPGAGWWQLSGQTGCNESLDAVKGIGFFGLTIGFGAIGASNYGKNDKGKALFIGALILHAVDMVWSTTTASKRRHLILYPR